MAKKKTEFERDRDYVVERIQELLKDLIVQIKENLKLMKKAPDVDALMTRKKYLLMEIIDHLPLGYDHCYFCIKYYQDCNRCEYGKKHGVCTKSGSNFDRIANLKNELEDLINDLYWDD